MAGHYRTPELLHQLGLSRERFVTAAALQDPGPLLQWQLAQPEADRIPAASASLDEPHPRPQS